MVGVVEPQIQEAEIRRSRGERPESIAAYDLYLRGLPLWSTGDDNNRQAISLFCEAVEIEPNNALYLAWAARAMQVRGFNAWQGVPPMTEQRRLIERALALAGDDATVLALCADAMLHARFDYGQTIEIARRAVELNPNNIRAVHAAGIINTHCGDLDEAVRCFERAINLNPRDVLSVVPMVGLAHVAMVRRDYEGALAWAEKSLARYSRYPATFWMLAAAHLRLGHTEAARQSIRDLLAINPDATVESIRSTQPDYDPSRIEPILEAMRLAGLPERKIDAPVLPSLAVLPFQNMSGDPEQEYFADGIVEDIITALSRFKTFAVIARNSSFTYKGRAVDVRQVAQ